VKPPANTLYDVDGRVVDLNIPHYCTCGSYVQTYLPCEHIAAAINLTWCSLTEFVDDVYKTTNLHQVYAAVLDSVDITYLQIDGYTMPPLVRHQAGRLKVDWQRNASSIAPEESIIFCSICHQSCHNQRTCGHHCH